MRILLFLLAVVPLSAMVIDIYLEREREGREAIFIDLAGKLVVEELGAPARQRVIGALVAAPEENGGQWGLRGKLFLADETGEKAHRRISANFEKICGAIDSTDCWQLASLVVDGKLVAPLPGGANEIKTASAAEAESPAPEPVAQSTAEQAPVLPEPQLAATEPAAQTDTEEVPAEPQSESANATQGAQEAQPQTAVAPEEPDVAERTDAEPPVEATPTAVEQIAETRQDEAPSAAEIAEEEAMAAPPQSEAVLEPVSETAPPPSRVAQRPAATIDLTKTMLETPDAAAEDGKAQTAKAAAPAKSTADIQSIALTAAVQAALNELGYNQSVPLKVDGKMGPRTRVAIRDYQRDHGLNLEGQPSRRLLFHMREQLKKRSAARIDSQKNTVSRPEVPAAPQVTEPEPQIATVGQGGLALPEAPEAPALHNGEHATGGAVTAARSQIATRSAASEPTAVQAASVIGTTRPSEANLDRGLIYLIQDRLVKLGYEGAEPLKLDGKFGDHTKALIVAYMRDHALTGEPEPSRELLRHMEEALRQARLRGNVGTQR